MLWAAEAQSSTQGWGQLVGTAVSELAWETKACPGASAADKGIRSGTGITPSLQCRHRIGVSCLGNKCCRSALTFIPSKDLVICALTRVLSSGSTLPVGHCLLGCEAAG